MITRREIRRLAATAQLAQSHFELLTSPRERLGAILLARWCKTTYQKALEYRHIERKQCT